MNPLTFFIEMIGRLRSANPPFFKKLQLGIILLMVLDAAFIILGVNIPAISQFINWETFGVLAILGGFSQLPNADPVKKNADDDGLVGGRPDDRKP